MLNGTVLALISDPFNSNMKEQKSSATSNKARSLQRRRWLRVVVVRFHFISCFIVQTLLIP